MKPNNDNNKGFSIVEALVAMAILAFVIVTILGGFSQQQMATRKNASKNVAIVLAEMRMEEMMKFPSDQLNPQVITDFIISKNNTFQYFDADPKDKDQFRRTTNIQHDILGQIATIQVMVEYGGRATNDTYPFRVGLSSRRGL